MVQRGTQFVGNAHAGARHWACVAESCAGPVIAAGAREFGDLGLHL